MDTLALPNSCDCIIKTQMHRLNIVLCCSVVVLCTTVLRFEQQLNDVSRFFYRSSRKPFQNQSLLRFKGSFLILNEK